MTKVIDLKKVQREQALQPEADEASVEDAFAAAIEQNKKVKERLAKERAKTNRSTLRSFKIK